jgi:hypothetical protein
MITPIGHVTHNITGDVEHRVFPGPGACGPGSVGRRCRVRSGRALPGRLVRAERGRPHAGHAEPRGRRRPERDPSPPCHRARVRTRPVVRRPAKRHRPRARARPAAGAAVPRPQRQRGRWRRARPPLDRLLASPSARMGCSMPASATVATSAGSPIHTAIRRTSTCFSARSFASTRLPPRPAPRWSRTACETHGGFRSTR